MTQPWEILSTKIAKYIRRHDSAIYRRGITEGRVCSTYTLFWGLLLEKTGKNMRAEDLYKINNDEYRNLLCQPLLKKNTLNPKGRNFLHSRVEF
jgi:hypothetical protein